MSVRVPIGLVACLLVTACGGGSQQAPASGASSSSTPAPTTPVQLSAPAIVLGRPTDSSVAASVKLDANTECYVEYGTVSGSYTGQTMPVSVASADQPVVVGITGLAIDQQYYYRVRYRPPGESAYRTDAERTFHTKRLSGRTFTFVVHADPHLDSNSSPAVYAQTMANTLADRPDFMVDLGDTSMVEKCAIDGGVLCASPSPSSPATVQARYALLRSYFEQACHSVPLFMALGNHDGETGWPDPGAGTSLAQWALAARKANFANPEPDAFYSGNTEQLPGGGFRQDYYAFEWGDSLIVVLDPYTYTNPKPGGNGWGWTLGARQYQWLAQTLSASRARFKFVFSHQLLGGNGTETRGGAAFASLFEWGGRNLDGTWGFDQQRPGWGAPIHRLLVDNRVTAWLHGHDHLYAREELDGVVYQEVPQPSLARYDTTPGNDYGYVGAIGENIFSSSGHLRITVSPTETKVEFVRSVAPADETSTRKNGTVVTSYVVR